MSPVIHVTAASLALIIGMIVLAMPKGTRRHRLFGRGYVALMLAVNVAALTIYEDSTSGFGVFHYLALVSLVTIAVGIGFVIFRRSIRQWRLMHAHMMAWSYVGLAAAATGQAGTSLVGNAGWPIAATLFVGGILVQMQVPRAAGFAPR